MSSAHLSRSRAAREQSPDHEANAKDMYPEVSRIALRLCGPRKADVLFG